MSGFGSQLWLTDHADKGSYKWWFEWLSLCHPQWRPGLSSQFLAPASAIEGVSGVSQQMETLTDCLHICLSLPLKTKPNHPPKANKSLLSHMISDSQGSRNSLDLQFWLRVSHGVAVDLSAGPVVSEELAVAGTPLSQKTLRSSKICHPQLHYFDKGIILSWQQMRTSS